MPVIISELEQFKKDVEFSIRRLLDFFYVAFQKDKHERFLVDIRKIEHIQIKYFNYNGDSLDDDEDEEDY